MFLVGCNGYLARFFAQKARDAGIKLMYGSHTASSAIDTLFLDLTDEPSVKAALERAAPKAVVNAAAMSSPRACQENPTASKAVNCPEFLVSACMALRSVPFLVHYSTDQVFDGNSPPYIENDSAAPLNVYASHKAEFDSIVAKTYPQDKFCILRPTNIVGPAAPGDGPTKFLQWLFNTLQVTAADQGSEPVRLFCDEYRNYVSVHDVVDCTLEVLSRAGVYQQAAAARSTGASGELATESTGKAATTSPPMATAPYNGSISQYPVDGVPQVVHVSGPESLTRVDVGSAVFQVVREHAHAAGASCRAEAEVIAPVPRSSVDIGYKSPLNLSTPPILFRRLMQREPRTLQEVVEDAFKAEV